jgi:hypothetical protein
VDESAKSQLYAAVRAIMYLIGATGIDLAHHFADEQTQVQIAGAIVFLVAYGLSVYDKLQIKHKLAEAVNVGIIAADRNTGPTPLVTPENAPKLIKIIAPTLPPVDELPNPLAGH